MFDQILVEVAKHVALNDLIRLCLRSWSLLTGLAGRGDGPIGHADEKEPEAEEASKAEDKQVMPSAKDGLIEVVR